MESPKSLKGVKIKTGGESPYRWAQLESLSTRVGRLLPHQLSALFKKSREGMSSSGGGGMGGSEGSEGDNMSSGGTFNGGNNAASNDKNSNINSNINTNTTSSLNFNFNTYSPPNNSDPPGNNINNTNNSNNSNNSVNSVQFNMLDGILNINKQEKSNITNNNNSNNNNNNTNNKSTGNSKHSVSFGLPDKQRPPVYSAEDIADWQKLDAVSRGGNG